jgi:hypothetical protein
LEVLNKAYNLFKEDQLSQPLKVKSRPLQHKASTLLIAERVKRGREKERTLVFKATPAHNNKMKER